MNVTLTQLTVTVAVRCDRCRVVLKENGVAVALSQEKADVKALELGWKVETHGCPEEGTPWYTVHKCPKCQNGSKR